MPPKVDAAAAPAVVIKMKCVGGEPAPASVLAPKLGPLGVPPKKAADEIQAATKAWKGIKVMVKLTIQNRIPTVEVVPSASPLVLKALGEPPRDRKKVKNVKHTGNLTMDQIIDIARTMRPFSQARKLQGTILEILGTANSVGCTVNGEAPRDIQAAIRAGTVTVPER